MAGRPAAALLDLDGVVYVGNRAIPGSIEAVTRLRRAGLALRFLTNTTRRPARVLLADLKALGLEIPSEELVTPAALARERLIRDGLRPHLLIHPALEEEFAGCPERGPPAVVIGDAGERFDYHRLNAAYRLLEEGAAFLALAKNRTFRDVDGALSIDAGAFVVALEYACRRAATVLGKPSPEMYRRALDAAGVAAADAVMVGDDAEADIGGAIAAGIRGVLVRTGKYCAGDEGRMAQSPDHIADDLSAAVDWLLG